MRRIIIDIKYDNDYEFKHSYLGRCKIIAYHLISPYPDYTIYSYSRDKHYRFSERDIFYAISTT